MSCMAGVHEVLVTTDKVQVLEADKNVQIKAGQMSLNRRLSCRPACQLRLECLNGRGYDDVSSQLVPNPDSCREEAVDESVQHGT